MKTPYVDPLVPLREGTDETLTRLSANIDILTGLMADAERTGHVYLAGMFTRSRASKVAEAKALIALVGNGGEQVRLPVANIPLKPKNGQRQETGNEDRDLGPAGFDL